MLDCIFCKIIDGVIPSKIVYEDEIVIVFMDVNPIENGHMLIVPKKHIDDFLALDNETAMYINEIAKKLADLVKNKLNPDGIKFVNNYGCEQLVKHYHLHLIPCYEQKQPIVDVDIIYDKLMK